MAITSSTGIFSGIETGKIIEQLMALERRPVEMLSRKKNDFNKKISSYGEISSHLTTLKNSLSTLKKNSFLAITASSSDSSVLTATATSSALEGSYNIKVNNIASSQSIYSVQFASENEEVADLSTNGIQKLRIQVGDNSPLDITIDSSNNTLSDVRNAINNSNAGVRASIINDGSGYRLVLSSNSTGASNRIKILVDEDNNGLFEETPEETDNSGISRLAFNAEYDANGNVIGGITNMTQSQAAIDASLTINGLTITRGSNSINNLISGVTINLKRDSSGNTINLSISRDDSRIISNINSFVSAYNSVINTIKNLTGKDKALEADSSLRTIREGLRTIITDSYSGSTLLSFGLSHDKFGVLSLDSSRLENAMKNNPQAVIDTFDSMAIALESSINTYIRDFIPARTEGAKSSIRFIENRIENIERILEKRETEYRRRFIALEKTIGQLRQSSDYLNQQFSILSKINGGK